MVIRRLYKQMGEWPALKLGFKPFDRGLPVGGLKLVSACNEGKRSQRDESAPNLQGAHAPRQVTK